MPKKINLYVKGSMAIGKTTFINAVRDILKRNKKFKELFDGYEFTIYELTVYGDGKEAVSGMNKKWEIKDGTLNETEFCSVHIRKSFIVRIITFIKNAVLKLLKII